MSPLGEAVNPDPTRPVHYVDRMVSRLQLEGARLEVRSTGDRFDITVSAPSRVRLQFALGRLAAEFQILAADVASGKR